MKRLIIILGLLGAALVIGSAFASFGKARAPLRELAVIEFTQPVRLMNVLLKGEYLVVHDERKMAQGKDCAYFYQRNLRKPDQLVVSFHCQPIQRERVNHFTVVLARSDTPYDVPEVLVIQFAGTTEGHQVP